jgi:hypothetical protein
MAHHNLGYRTKTHSGTFIDEEEMATTIVDFVTSFRNLSTSLQVPASRIFNMDQTAVYYDNAPLKTIEKHGSRSISIRTSAAASHRVTVFLCVSFTGVKLSPLVVFKATRNKTVFKKLKQSDRDGCSSACEYTVQENGWCDQMSMDDWIQNFCNDTNAPNQLKILLLDNFSVHCTQETRSKLAECNTYLELLPPNFTSKLQPLDVGINKPFKDRLKRLYVEDASKIATGDNFQVTRQMISHWIAKAWMEVPTSAITNTVRRIGYI